VIRVYVAGKYSDDNVLSLLNNIRRGIQLCKELFLAGYAPFCPWLDHQYVLQMSDDEINSTTVKMFHDYSMAWLDAADCMLVIPDRIETSRGVQAELSRAKEIGMPIFYDKEDLHQWAGHRG
jgi:hypothetical protein